MNGFSTTLLYAKNDDFNNMLSLLDAHTSAPSWPSSYGRDLTPFEYVPALSSTTVSVDKQADNEKYIKFQDQDALKFILKTICEDLILFKEHLNKVKQQFIFNHCFKILRN